MAWAYDPRARRYRDTDTGRFLTSEAARGFVDQSLRAGGIVTDQLASLVAQGQLSPEDWRLRMRAEIKGEYVRQYLLGRGGLEQMTAADWGSVGGALSEQYRWLDRRAESFFDQVEAEELSEEEIARRARMYINSAREAYERGQVRRYGIPVLALPAYPGDGSSECLTNCRCYWNIQEIFGEEGEVIAWEATWTLTPGESCPTCVDRGLQWAPYVVEVTRHRTYACRRPTAPDAGWMHGERCDCGQCREAHESGIVHEYAG